MTQNECQQRWEELKVYGVLLKQSEVVAQIDAINNDTPWSEVEPEWWVEMMDVRRKCTEKVM